MATIQNGKVVYGSGELLPQQGSKDYLNAQQGMIISNTLPTISTGNIIDIKPISVTNPAPNTGAITLSADIGARAEENRIMEAESARLANERTNLDLKSKNVIDKLLGTTGQTELASNAYTETGLDTARQEVNRLNNEILAEQLSARRQIEALQSNGAITKEQAQAFANEINRKSTSKQADLAILQMAAQNNYTGAKEIADRKVQAQLEQQRNNIAAAEFDFNNSKDLYTKAEQRQYDALLSKQKRELDTQETNAKTFETTKIDLLKQMNINGAPEETKRAVALMDPSQGIGALINTAGQYGGDMLGQQYKQSQIDKMNADARAADAADAAVNPDVLQGMINVYKATGVLPAFGMSAKSPLRAQFYAALGADGNIVTDANTNKAVRAGLSSAYTNQQKILSANETAIGTLDKQLLLAKQYSDQVSRSGSPLVAKYVLGVKSGVFGDPDAAALNNIVKTASYEFAKILSGSAASIAGVTVSSAADAESMLNSSMSKGQFNEVVNLMQKEAQFRIQSQRETLSNLEKDLKNVGTLSNNLKESGVTAKTVKVNGQEYVVGQVYNDGTANWTVDANGVWTKL